MKDRDLSYTGDLSCCLLFGLRILRQCYDAIKCPHNLYKIISRTFLDARYIGQPLSGLKNVKNVFFSL